MKRTIKVGYMIKDPEGSYSGCPSDFYDDYAEVFFDKYHAKDVFEEMKRFDDKLELVTVVMCEISQD
jgi:hypothetical protein